MGAEQDNPWFGYLGAILWLTHRWIKIAVEKLKELSKSSGLRK